MALPETVADHDRLCRVADYDLVRCEPSTKNRFDSQQGQRVESDPVKYDALAARRARKREVKESRNARRLIECPALCPPLENRVEVRDALDRNQLCRVFKWQRPNDHGVDYGKDRAGCPNTQGERQNGHGCKPAISRKYAHRVDDVAPEVFNLGPHRSPALERLSLAIPRL